MAVAIVAATGTARAYTWGIPARHTSSATIAAHQAVGESEEKMKSSSVIHFFGRGDHELKAWNRTQLEVCMRVYTSNEAIVDDV